LPVGGLDTTAVGRVKRSDNLGNETLI
jgi:hypothetical protein